MQNQRIKDDRICVSVDEARRMLGLGLTRFYEEVKQGRIALVKAGRKSLVTVDELRKWPARVSRAADNRWR